MTYTDTAAGSWLGIFKKEATLEGSNLQYAWKYVGGSGSTTLKAPAEPGSYALYYFPDGGYSAVESKLITVKRQSTKIFIDRETYMPGDTMTITYKDAESTSAWVGIYTSDKQPSAAANVNSIVWTYVPKAGDGTTTLTVPTALGDYKVFLLKDSGYTIVDYVDFSVVDSSNEAPVAPKNVTFTPDASCKPGYADGVFKAEAGEARTDGVLFYWGNESGVLEGYTYIGYGTYNDAQKGYVYTSNKGNLIPAEATRVYAFGVNGSFLGKVLFGTHRMSEESVSCAIPVQSANLGKKLYTFQVISDLHVDLHVEGTANKTTNDHVIEAFTDLSANFADTAGVFVVGDTVNHGSPEQYARLSLLVDTHMQNMPLYYTVGNHEFYYNQLEGAASGTFFDENWARFRAFAGIDEGVFYRYIKKNGDYFILLGEEARGPDTAAGYYSEAQREWLRDVLKLAASEGANAFVFMHQSIDETVSGSFASRGQGWSGINDDALMKEVIESYPNTYLFTGHSHWTLHSYGPFINGGTTGASYFNTASCGYLWCDSDSGIPGSEGLCVEVYEKGVVVRGRSFETREWIPCVYAAVEKNTDYPTNEEPWMVDSVSLRLNEQAGYGVRFAAFVDSVRREQVDEYGFIASLATEALTKDATRLVMDKNGSLSGINAHGVRYVGGVAYKKSTETNIEYSATGEEFGDNGYGAGHYYAAVLRGIPARGAKEPLCIRPYIRMGDKVFYGKVAFASLYDTALALRNSSAYATLGESEKAYVERVLEAE